MKHPITISSRGYTSKYRIHIYGVTINGLTGTFYMTIAGGK